MVSTLVFTINAMAFAIARLEVAKRLKSSGIETIFVSYSKECDDYLKKNSSFKIVNIIDEFDKINFPADETDRLLTFYEQKYELPGINLLFLGDVNYTWLGRETSKNHLIKHFIFWENFLKNNKIDFIVGGMERFINEVPRAVSKNFNIPHYMWKFPPVNGYFLLLREHLGRWETLNDYWEKNKEKQLSTEELKQAKEYITVVKEKGERSHIISRKLVVNLGEINWFLQRSYANLFIEKLRNPYGRTVWKIARERFKRVLRKNIARFLYEEPVQGEKFIYYPLHVQVDAQVLVRCPQYKNQLALIQSLADFLPYGYTLYVTEHPNNVGGVKIKELYAMKKTPNVKLINPKTHTHKLLKECSALITINSNAGWEGLLFDKPVIVLGSPFYDISGLTFNVKDLFTLPQVFKQALKQKEVNKDILYKFISAMFKNIHPGKAVHQEGHVESFIEEENLKKIVEGFKKVLRR